MFFQARYMEARHCLAAANVIAGLAGEVPSEAAAKESMSNVLKLSCCLHFNSSSLFVFTSTKSVDSNPCPQTGRYLG